MSLFPAYASASDPPDASGKTQQLQWLKNDSYSGERSSNTDAAAVVVLHDVVDVGLQHTSTFDRWEIDDIKIPVKDHVQNDSEVIERSPPRHKQHKHQKERDAKKKKKKKKHKHKHEDDYQLSSRERKHDQADILTEVTSIPAGKVFLADIHGLKTPFAYCIDRKPDKNNFACGALYKLQIAKYKRYCLRDGCLGTQDPRGSSHFSAQDVRYFRKHREQGSKSTYVGSRPEFKEVMNSVKAPVKRSQQRSCVSFIPIEMVDDVNSSTESQLIDGSSDHDNKSKSAFRQTTAEFNKRLLADPQNVQLWLDFVELQTSAVHDDDSLLKEVSVEHAAASVAELKAAILERAIQSNPQSIDLRLALINICERIWDADKVAAEWKNLVFLHPNNPQVWRHYVRYMRSMFGVFSVDRVLAAYSRAISTLRAVQEGTVVTHRALPNSAYHLIGLFVEMCAFLRGAGHFEKAVAFFQAELEFNLNRPAIIGSETSHRDAVDFMSVFWESGAPKVGESGSAGWSSWVEQGGVHSNGEFWYSKENDEVTDQSLVSTNQERSSCWVAMESSRDTRHWLPWRFDLDRGESSAEDCEDPERVVLFDDISGALFTVSSPSHRYQLISGFLRFLTGVECDPFVTFHEWSALLESYRASDCAAMIWRTDIAEDLWTKVGDVFRLNDCKTSFENIHAVESRPSFSEQFVGNLFEQTIPKFSDHFRTVLTLKYVCFKLGCYIRLRSTASSDETKRTAKELRKFFKSLLRIEHNRGCLPVWECYALFEWETGNIDEARKVLETAIQMAGTDVTKLSSNTEDSAALIHLYRIYVSLEFGLRDDVVEIGQNFGFERERLARQPNVSRCLRILVAMCDGKFSDEVAEMSPVMRLRVDRLLAQRFSAVKEQFICAVTSSSKLVAVLGLMLVSWTICAAVFKYITEGLSAAMEQFSVSIASIKSMNRSDQTEDGDLKDEILTASVGCGDESSNCLQVCCRLTVRELTRACNRFLCSHMSAVPTPRRTLRLFLDDALESLPEDRHLLNAFVDVETAGCISVKLRSYFHRSVTSARSPVPFIFAILSERKRMLKLLAANESKVSAVADTGIIHQMRSWFEQAVNHESSKRCPLVWRMYMYFEAEVRSSESVKAVFYRSLQFCPWSKNLYVDCVRLVPSMLQAVLDLMTEKGLRVRVPVEELDLLMTAARVVDDLADTDSGDRTMTVTFTA